MNGELDGGLIRRLAAEKGCRYEIECVEQTDSTNNVLKQLAVNGAEHGKLLIAGSQTAGRGRLGRSFFSPDSGIYMSLLLRPSTSPDKTLFFTTAAAVAVCRAIENTTELTAGIKWVNDIYIGEKKVCGILTEAAIEGGVTGWAVVGIGVNIAHPQNGFPGEIADRACALFDGKAPCGFRERFAAELAVQLYRIYSTDEFMSVEEYRRRSVLIGRILTAYGAGGEEQCRAVGIDDSAALLVEYPDGTAGRLISGEVSIRL